MARRRGQTVATSMPHCKAYSPARYCEITGARRAPRHHQDPKLSSALEYAKHKTNLGYRLFVEFIARLSDGAGRIRRGGSETVRFPPPHDTRTTQGTAAANTWRSLPATCATCARPPSAPTAKDAHTTPTRAVPNAKTPSCARAQTPASYMVMGFWCSLSDAPNQPLLASRRVFLRFPITPSRHAMEIQLTPNVVERIATAVSAGAVTINNTTASIAYEPQPVQPVQPKGMMGMDVNKREHVIASTDGEVDHIVNGALGFAQERRRRHAILGVTGGRPKHPKARTKPRYVKNPGSKPRNKGKRSKKRRDWRVNRRERARINSRFVHRKNDWLFKTMHGCATRGYALVLEESAINRLLVRSNRMMSREQRDLLKMGLSQGIIRAVADGVFKKYGLSVYGVTPAGTSSECPKCGEKLWAAKYRTRSWKSWKRVKACTACLYYVDRDDVAGINILRRGVSAYEPAAGPAPLQDGAGRQVAGDWEQCVPQLVQTLLDAAVVWMPYVGEGRRPKGDAKKPAPYEPADARFLDDRLDVSTNSAGIGPPGETPGVLC